MAASQPEIQVKLLYDNETGRILYMEAGKDLVDLLFSFLLLPAADAIRVLEDAGHRNNIGSISNVYRSAQKLKETVFLDGKQMLLKPSTSKHGFSQSALLLKASSGAEPANARIYKCNCSTDTIFTPRDDVFCSKCITKADRGVNLYRCPCGQVISSALQSDYQVDCQQGRHYTTKEFKVLDDLDCAIVWRSTGFVKENVTFMITDDLQVKLSSTIDSIMLLNKLKVEKISPLNSIDVHVTVKEALDLLEASYITEQALTYVFAARVKSEKDNLTLQK